MKRIKIFKKYIIHFCEIIIIYINISNKNYHIVIVFNTKTKKTVQLLRL